MVTTAVIVCGSRTIDSPVQIDAVLDTFGFTTETTIMTGGATGADTFAHEYAVTHDFNSPIYFAEWAKYGRSAGPKRNQRMLDELLSFTADRKAVIAFFDKPVAESRGTAHMCRIAREAGIPVFLYDVVTGSLIGRY